MVVYIVGCIIKWMSGKKDGSTGSWIDNLAMDEWMIDQGGNV